MLVPRAKTTQLLLLSNATKEKDREREREREGGREGGKGDEKAH